MINTANKNIGFVSFSQIAIYMAMVAVIAIFNCACLKAPKARTAWNLENLTKNSKDNTIPEKEFILQSGIYFSDNFHLAE